MNQLRVILRLACAAIGAAILAMPQPVVAFSTSSTCLGLMVQSATIELGPGAWPAGTHTVAVRYVDPMFDVDVATTPVTFTVADGTPLYPGQVRVDQDGLFRGYVGVPGQAISPLQDTVLWAAWAWDMTGEVFGGPPSTMREMKADAAQAEIRFSIDGGPWLPALMSPVHSVCANGALGGTNDVPLHHRTWGPSTQAIIQFGVPGG